MVVTAIKMAATAMMVAVAAMMMTVTAMKSGSVTKIAAAVAVV